VSITAALKNRHNVKNEKYERAYNAGGHRFVTCIISTRGPIHPEAQRLLYFIAAATTRQHMHYYTTDLKYKTVMARNIQRFNAVASAAIGLGIAVGARGLARGRIGQDTPRHGWRMQEDIVAAITRGAGRFSSSLVPAVPIGSYGHSHFRRALGWGSRLALKEKPTKPNQTWLKK